MDQLSAIRLRGRPTGTFDPARATVTEAVTEEAVFVRIEQPRDAEFWTEFTLTEEWLAAKLAEVRARKLARVVAEQVEAQRVAAASMSAWTPGREFA